MYIQLVFVEGMSNHRKYLFALFVCKKVAYMLIFCEMASVNWFKYYEKEAKSCYLLGCLMAQCCDMHQ